MSQPPSQDALGTTARNGASALRAWLRAFVPAPLNVDGRERLRAVAGALLGILFTAGVSQWLAGSAAAGAWLLAPLGASAVLVFAAPASPLAQPWSVVGGNTVSALIGVLCAAWLSDVVPAAAAAVALAIATMFALRCLHPPGGAMALSAVLMHAAHGHLALEVALVNSVLLVLVGLAYNAATGRAYPHMQAAPREVAAKEGDGGDAVTRFKSEDLDKVLARYNQVLDISRDDLETLLHEAEMEGMRRRATETLCRDVMSPHVVTVDATTPLDEAWRTMRERGIKALPVVDRSRALVGIVTMADFLRAAGLDDGKKPTTRRRIGMPSHETASAEERGQAGQNGQQGLQGLGRPVSFGRQSVGQIMTRQVRVASADRHAMALLPLFTEGGHHHIPVIDEHKRVVGIITQSDFVRALYRIEH